MEFKDEVKKILKDEGLDIAEDAAKAVVKVGFRIIEAAVIKSSTKWDDIIVLPLINILRPKAIELLDKIDGEKG